MALQIWLPLNGSIQNKGLNNGVTITKTGTGAVGLVTDKRGGVTLTGNANWRIGNITLGTDVTVAWWSKTTVNVRMPWVLESNATPLLCFYENSIYTLNTGDSNNNPFRTTANANINALHDGIWHHFAVVFDANKVLLYIDGEYAGQALTYRSPVTTNKFFKVAGDYNGTHTYDWSGSLTDVRLYDNALTEQDVRKLYLCKMFEFSPQWGKVTGTNGSLTAVYDKAGRTLLPTPYNITTTGNVALFNGANTYISFNGLTLTGGGISMWVSVPAKPTAQKIYYCDPASKMIVGHLSNGNILSAAYNDVNKPSYQPTGITWGQMTHIVAVWDSAYTPTALYVNGAQPATGTSSCWSNGGLVASIGRRIGVGAADYLSGSVNEVKVFASQLTAEDAMTLYKAGPDENAWKPSEPIWIRVLHHESPKDRLFTTANCTDNDDEKLFSKLKLFFNSDIFKRSNGTYEFMVKEKLEATSEEQVYVWKQTSNPTASTITGYQLISATSTPYSDVIGLKHNGSYACFHNGGTWWCACGSYNAFQGGIPGFGGIVKSGYIDLYIRADK